MTSPYRAGPTLEELAEQRRRREIAKFFEDLRRALASVAARWVKTMDGAERESASAAARWVKTMNAAEREFRKRFVGK